MTKPEEHNSDHTKYMARALELAALGLGKVSPNPLVGCVVVHDDQIVGEGFHESYGSAHAEVNAINSVEDQSILPECDVYVTLEPCSHFGKTPPCADMLARKQVKSVYFSCYDPNPLVAGNGQRKLKDANILAESGLLETESRFLNRRFLTFHEQRRPYIILKWAQTSDGFIARKNFDSKWISNEASRNLVHQWRAEEDAILVGTNTAKHDDPRLNVRGWEGDDPVRIVIDKKLELDKGLSLFDKSQPTLVYNTQESRSDEVLEYVRVEGDFLQGILEDLFNRKIQSLIVEGGTSMLKSFIDSELWDEARIFKSNNSFGEGISAPEIEGHLIDQRSIESDQLEVYLRQEPIVNPHS